MRFDSPEHLQAWKENGSYPAIHNNLYAVIATEFESRSFLDLGCNSGLLGTQIKNRIKYSTVAGVDGSLDAINAGISAKIPIPLHHLQINTVDHIMELAYLIKEYETQVLICRRILPEIFGNREETGKLTPQDGMEFAKVAAGYGIRQIFIEGRKPTKTPQNALYTIRLESLLFSEHYNITIHERENIAVLRIK